MIFSDISCILGFEIYRIFQELYFLAFWIRFRGQGVKAKHARHIMALYVQGRSAGTLKNYSVEIRRLVNWCLKKRYNPLALREAQLGRFLVSRARRGISKSQLSNLSAAVNLLSEITGFSNPFLSPIIRQVKRAILKQGYRVRPKAKAPALSLQQFRNIVKKCYNPNASLVPFSKRRFLVMSVFCFLGMRRFADIVNMKFKHFQIRRNNEIMCWVPISKTDSLGIGWFFTITSAGFGDHTAASLLRWYTDSLPPHTRSNFLFPTARLEKPNITKPVPYSTARHHLNSLREELCLGKSTWHSFRRGSATAAAAAGVSKDYIKRQGKWRSEAVEVYIETLTLGNEVGRAIVEKF